MLDCFWDWNVNILSNGRSPDIHLPYFDTLPAVISDINQILVEAHIL